MLTLDKFQAARDQGFDDSTMLEAISKRDPEFGERIKKGRDQGFDDSTLIQAIEKRLRSAPQQPQAITPIFNGQQTQQPKQQAPQGPGLRILEYLGIPGQIARKAFKGKLPEAVSYAREGFQNGKPAEQINKELREQGWTENDIHEIFGEVFPRKRDTGVSKLKAEDIDPWKLDVTQLTEITPEQLQAMSPHNRLVAQSRLWTGKMGEAGEEIADTATVGIASRARKAIGKETKEGDELLGPWEKMGASLVGAALPFTWASKMLNMAKYGLGSLKSIIGHSAIAATQHTIQTAIQNGDLPKLEEITGLIVDVATFEGLLRGAINMNPFKKRVASVAKAEGITEIEAVQKIADESGISKAKSKQEAAKGWNDYLAKKRATGELAEQVEPATPVAKKNTKKAVVREYKEKQKAKQALKAGENLEAVGGLATGMVDSLYGQLFDSLQKGSTKMAGIEDPILKAAAPAYKRGEIKSPEDLRKFANDLYAKKAPAVQLTPDAVKQLAKQKANQAEANVAKAKRPKEKLTASKPAAPEKVATKPSKKPAKNEIAEKPPANKPMSKQPGDAERTAKAEKINREAAKEKRIDSENIAAQERELSNLKEYLVDAEARDDFNETKAIEREIRSIEEDVRQMREYFTENHGVEYESTTKAVPKAKKAAEQPVEVKAEKSALVRAKEIKDRSKVVLAELAKKKRIDDNLTETFQSLVYQREDLKSALMQGRASAAKEILAKMEHNLKVMEEANEPSKPKATKKSTKSKPAEAKPEPETKETITKQIEEAKADLKEEQAKEKPSAGRIRSIKSFIEEKKVQAAEVSSQKPQDLAFGLGHVSKWIQDKFFKDQGIVEKAGWNMVRDYFGPRWFADYQAKVKWNLDLKERFPDAKVREDMIYYREKTGNPFVDASDSFADVKKRLSPEAKAFVDTELDAHLDNALKEFNASPYTQDINPRQFVQDTYIPHFYEATPAQAKKVLDGMGPRFSTKNPFANKRTFLSYNEALQKKGLIPKYRDIGDLMEAYDNMLTKIKTNQEIAVKINDLQKDTKQRLIMRPGQKGYENAKAAGWIPFEDPYLRRKYRGTDENGKAIWTTAEGPALVSPDLASALAGVFVREFKRPPLTMLQKGLRATIAAAQSVDNLLRYIRVTGSLFHLNSLMEGYSAARGWQLIPGQAIVQSYRDFKRMGKMMRDPAVMREPLEAGLKVEPPVEHTTRAFPLLTENLKKMELKGGNYKRVAKAMQTMTAPVRKLNEFLFGQYHPRMKTAMYFAYKQRALDKYAKEGRVLSAKEMKLLNREVATIVNNQMGGQRWENMKHLNDPKMLGYVDNLIAYPDWTISALREIKDIGAKGMRGKLARGYLGRYVVGLLYGANLWNYGLTGIDQDKKTKKVRWNPDKARFIWQNPDPKKSDLMAGAAGQVSIALPDVEVDLGPLGTVNLGRDEKGRQLYMHGGKKLFEVLHWGTDTWQEGFNKLRPGFQFLAGQMFGYSPSGFPVEAGYDKHGDYKPWGGSEPMTAERILSRLKHATSFAVPFALGSIMTEGPKEAAKRYLVTGGGALPISKGVGLREAENYFEKYYRKNDNDGIIALKRLLLDQGYSLQQVESKMSSARNRVTEERNASKAVRR